MASYIYLLIEREFIKTGEDIYKLGHTTQETNKRFGGYPKGSIIFFLKAVYHSSILEKKLLKKMKKKYIHRPDIGLEYFEGDPDLMIKLMYNYITKHNYSYRIKKMISDHSTINDYIKMRITKTEDNKCGLSITDVYNDYNSWCNEINTQPCSRQEISVYFDKIYGKRQKIGPKRDRGTIKWQYLIFAD